ncbi:MAG: hypothetical protein HRU20_21810 [Pseudomonadales bacterium]|nr:hypothetical protein [Pseudomonadales bacterium]
MPAQELSINDLPKFDPRIFWINIRYKLLIPILVGMFVALLAHQLTKQMMPKHWQASTYLIRHGKNMARQSDIPYLYLQTDLSTVLETILLRKNLQHVIDVLKLDMTPQALRQKISVNKGSKSNVVKVTSTSSDQQLSVQIADLISETFLINYASVQNSAAKKIHVYYSNRLEHSKQQIFDLKMQDKKFKQQFNILDFEAQKSNLYKSVADLELRYLDEKINLSDIQARLQEVGKKLANTQSTTLISRVVRGNENTLTKNLKSELEILRKRYTDANPKIQHLMHQISVLEKEKTRNKHNTQEVADETKFGYNPVYGELQLLTIEYDGDILATKGNLKEYQEGIERVKDKISSLADLEQKHYQLAQSIDEKNELIRNLNRRLIETSIAMESNISDFDILEYAQSPLHPKRSFRKVISLGLAIISLILLVIFIVFREVIDSTIKTAFDLQHVVGAAFTSVLPNKDSVSHGTFYSQFHLLFSAVNQQLLNRHSLLLCVYSLNEGEGKSFMANEMIEHYNNQNKRVLHIESCEASEYLPRHAVINDLIHRGSLCDELQTKKLSNQLDKCYFELNEKIYLDILEVDQLQAFVDSCRTEYDLIIWELFSPNMHLQLFKTIGQVAAFNLFIVKSCSIPKAEVTSMLSMLNQWGIHHVGLLLNLLPNKYLKHTV